MIIEQIRTSKPINFREAGSTSSGFNCILENDAFSNRTLIITHGFKDGSLAAVDQVRAAVTEALDTGQEPIIICCHPAQVKESHPDLALFVLGIHNGVTIFTTRGYCLYDIIARWIGEY